MNTRNKQKRRRMAAALADLAGRLNENGYRVVTRDSKVVQDGYVLRTVEWYDMRRRDILNIRMELWPSRFAGWIEPHKL